MKLLVVLVVSPRNCILCSETFCTEHHGANRDCNLLAFPKVTFAAQQSDLTNDDNDAYISYNIKIYRHHSYTYVNLGTIFPSKGLTEFLSMVVDIY
uniref:Uncharacterized protein n=1 Tax=Glossina palpalis gambiensis TaxID=67801 RepID=A0A1B0BKH7_9MUSC